MSNANSLAAAPYLVSDQVTLAPNGTAIADSAALSQPFRRPFWVDEVRWNVRGTGFGGRGIVCGARVLTRLALGRLVISDKFIPIWNYGTEVQQRNAAAAQADSVFGGDTQVSFSAFRWRLPKPLYVPAGNALTSEFQRGNDGNNNNLLVTVSYAGRYMNPHIAPPREIDIPFVCAFLPPTGLTVAQSSEQDLYNPFMKPLDCQRMIGRILTNDLRETYVDDTQIYMKDSYGNNVVRDYAPFNIAFEFNRRAWTFNRELKAREMYSASLSSMTSTSLVSISLIATRKERP